MTAHAMPTSIERAFVSHGERVAIEEADGRAVTYRELLARARELARGVRAGAVVAVDATRDADFVARCLGAWLAGAAWLPIDPREPPARRAEIVRRARDADRGAAYLIATSGTTGAPKLVVVGHGGIAALLAAQIDAFRLAPGARSLWLHAPAFDASLSDWGCALASGATLVCARDARDVRGELARRAITHVDLPTALLAQLDEPPPGLRVVVLGGDACDPARVRALARRARVVVVYGPTEATVCTSLVAVDAATWTRPLVGAPLPGITYRVADDGELWIAGAALAPGYAGDRDETARRFVVERGTRWYRTGDRVEQTPHGLAFVGRLDRQRKLAGGRIELDAIEAVVRATPGVRDTAVEVRGGRLVAFVDGDGALGARAVRDAARAALPAWQVPVRVVVAPLPRTATGKIDRAALAVPAARPATGDDLERELAALWCDAIGCDAALADDTFSAAGGDSLAALAFAAGADARGLALADDALAGDPTFAELVARARSGASADAPLPVAECERRGLVALAARSAPIVGAGARDAVLITGATGRLGGALVRAWRARDPRPLIALVRNPDDARVRFPDVEIELVHGDLAQLVLDERVAARLSAVVHCAATIRLAHGWAAHAAVNVDATAELARLARAAGAAFHHVSTLSVFTETDRAAGRHAADASPPADARAHGGYAQTKLAAEALARALAARATAPTTIFRLGLLVSATAAAAAPRDQLAMTIRGLARLASIPSGARALRFDTTDVDHAARAIAELALRAERERRDAVHHIASAHGATFGELVDALRAQGVPLVDEPPAAWAARAREQLADPDVAMAYLSLGRAHREAAHARRFDLFQATDADFSVDDTARLVGPAPRVELAALVRAALERA